VVWDLHACRLTLWMFGGFGGFSDHVVFVAGREIGDSQADADGGVWMGMC
jgi:hypothetical protein